MDENEAYRAMYYFLEDYYNRTKSDEIGGLLGGMAILQDGNTADAAYWQDWQDAVKRAKNDEESVKFNLVK